MELSIVVGIKITVFSIPATQFSICSKE